MSSQTGTVSSTTGTSVGAGAAQWANPNNIFTSNNTYAVSGSIAIGLTTGYIYALGSGFSIPTSATIDGLEVYIEGKNAVAGTGFRVRPTSNDVFLIFSGADISPNSPSGVATATWTATSDSIKILGSSTASWSASLTPSIVNDSSFGVKVRFQNANATAQTFSIDSIIITVYYTYAGASFSSQQLFMCEG